MPNTLNFKPDKLKFLIIGDPKMGKTRFCGTFPKPFIASCDAGIASLAGKDIEYEIFVDEDRYVRSGVVWDKFDARMKQVIVDPKFETIVIDGFTMLSEWCYDYYQVLNNNVDKPGGYAIYGLMLSRLGDIIRSIRRAGKWCVVTALLEVSKDENIGIVGAWPKTRGSVGESIGPRFDEIYYARRVAVQGQYQYRMQTKPQGMYHMAGSRVDCLDEFEVPDFSVIKAKVEKKFGVLGQESKPPIPAPIISAPKPASSTALPTATTK